MPHSPAVPRAAHRRGARGAYAIAAVAAALVFQLAGTPHNDAAAAIGCPDVEVIFARGATEPPGFGAFGQQFVDALRWRLPPAALAAYPVNYPATREFPPTVDGVVDVVNHVHDTAANCPDTAVVLAGFSRGAAVIGYAIDPAAGLRAPDEPASLSADAAEGVAAIALLGRPSNDYLASLGAPPLMIDPSYASRTIDLCAAGDPICSAGGDPAAHTAYAANGMIQQAVDFVAERLNPPAAPEPPV